MQEAPYQKSICHISQMVMILEKIISVFVNFYYQRKKDDFINANTILCLRLGTRVAKVKA
jgi:hypothetical protein